MRKDDEKFINEQYQHIEKNSIRNSLKDFYPVVRRLTGKLNTRIDAVKMKVEQRSEKVMK